MVSLSLLSSSLLILLYTVAAEDKGMNRETRVRVPTFPFSIHIYKKILTTIFRKYTLENVFSKKIHGQLIITAIKLIYLFSHDNVIAGVSILSLVR